jgi:divalent metal cation (Fe/Co/Zn/Cd) transporter
MFKFLNVMTATPTEQLVDLMTDAVDVITALFSVVAVVIGEIWTLIVSNAIFTLPIALILVGFGFKYLRRLINLLKGMFGGK